MAPPAHQAGPAAGYSGPYGSTLRLTVQGSVLTSSLVAPSFTIDGHPIQTGGYGEFVIPVPPGQHLVRGSAQWMREYGQAELLVDVPAETTVDVFYAAPLHQFTTGSMGLTRQHAKGRGILIAVVVAVVVLIVIAVVAGLLG